MRQPAFAHLTGYAMWRRCDHDRTRISEDPARVVLAPKVVAAGPAADPQPWRGVHGGAVRVDCPPDLCADGRVVMADPQRGLLALGETGWTALPSLSAMPVAAPAGPLEFGADPAPPTPLAVRDIARDAAGRIWLLAADGQLLVLSPGFALIDAIWPAGPAKAIAIAACAWGVGALDGDRLLVQPLGGTWRAIALPAPAMALAGDPDADFLAALLQDGRLVVLRREGLTIHDHIPELTAPLFLLVTGKGRVLLGEPRGAPGGHGETRFILCRLDPADGLVEEGSFAVRGFDGRALWRDGDTVLASTAQGARPLYPDQAPGETEGVVETFALDSTIFACVWHRVFIDACLLPGTRIEIAARTADDLPPRQLWRPARPPADVGGAALLPVPEDDPWPPLGSTDTDDGVWHPLGVLDQRGPMADIPDPPGLIARPSGDELGAIRSQAVIPWPKETLEGLIKAPPGRYLWLRIKLLGTERRSPAVLALRATYQRPSLLDLLPSYWRADPLAADAADRALSLFEGSYTEIDARITALRRFADPRLVPAEALDWLASHVALAFDQRLGEPARRQLLAETATLYRRRGTLPCLTRLLEIVSGGPVQIIEGFRTRHSDAPFLGSVGDPLGETFQLGGEDGLGMASDDPADAALIAAHLALQLRRAAAGDAVCPSGEIPFPVETDPLARFVRRFAHRFTVILPRCHTDVLAALIVEAIEANKPAHTLHRLCWLDAGFQLDRAAMIGIARLGQPRGFELGVLGAAVLGRAGTLGRRSQTDFGFHPGNPIGRAQRETIGERP